jgi:hypothetical protein
VKKQKMPRDVNLRAKMTLDLMTGEAQVGPEHVKDPAAVELGRKGGLIGGHARAAKLTAEQRSAIAMKAAAARWSRSGD